MSTRVCVIVVVLAATSHVGGEQAFAQRRFREQQSPPSVALPVRVVPRSERPAKAPSDGSPAGLRGVARNETGEYVANVKVWLCAGQPDPGPPVATQTDDAGRFSFAVYDDEMEYGRSPWAKIAIARDDQGRLGWQGTRIEDLSRFCEIRLGSPVNLEGQVIDEDGMPVSGVRLTPRALSKGIDGERLLRDHVYLFEELASTFSAVTDDDGKFKLRGLPRVDYAECRLAGPGGERALLSLNVDGAATIRLRKFGSIAGSVLPPEGAPEAIEGFQLHVTRTRDAQTPSDDTMLVFETVATDAAGAFRVGGLPPGRYTVVPGRFQNHPFYGDSVEGIVVEPGQKVKGVTIPLLKGRLVTGRVVERETGRGIESVGLRVGSRSPKNIMKSVSVKTDFDGRFTAWLTPGSVHVYREYLSTEYFPPVDDLTGYRMIDDNRWPVIEVERAATLEGIVVDEEGHPVPFANLGIDRALVRLSMLLYEPRQCDEAGRFILRQVPHGEAVTLRARTSTAATESAVIITPPRLDGPIKLVVSEKSSCWIRGRVVDEDGRPLRSATVSLVECRSPPSATKGSRNDSQWVVCKPSIAADGSFESEALWPDIDYYLEVSAPGYTEVASQRIRGQPGNISEVAPIALERFLMVTGGIVDGQGRPLANADVWVALPPRSPGVSVVPLKVQSDAAGWFVLPQVKKGGTLRIWARAGDAATKGVQTFEARKSDEKVKVVLEKENASRVCGKVVDGQGRRVPGASVAVQWYPSEIDPAGRFPRRGSRGGPSSIAISNAKTDIDGRFVTDVLWPDEHYRLEIAAAGHETVELPAVLRGAGKTAEMGEIVVRRGGLTLEGQVVDAARKPVPKATVINSGDASQPLEVETDAEGRFRLEELFEGPVHLLFRKDGYWPAGLRAIAGASGERAILIDATQPRPESRPPDADQERPSAEERDVARRLITRLWRIRDQLQASARDWGRRPASLPRDLVRLMAKIDPEQAAIWSTVERGQFDDVVRREQALRHINDDVEKALAPQAGLLPGELIAMARRRAASGAKDDSRRLLEAALVLADKGGETTSPQQAPVVWHAEIGRAAIAAGLNDWGRRLVVETADRVENTGDGMTIDARGAVAIALAAFDAPRAERTWITAPEVSQQDRPHADWFAARLAVALAPRDLAAARRVAATQRHLQANAMLTEMARKIAPYDPDQAVALIEEIAGNYSELKKAEALAIVAAAMAPDEHARACDLVDRALEICRPEHLPTGGVVNRSEHAARVAIAACELGYPDMRSVVARVLALRLTAKDLPSGMTRAVAAVNTVRLLALVDPHAALDLLTGVARPADELETRMGEPKFAEWLQAWALVDLKRAEEIVNQTVNEQDRVLSRECAERALVPMIELILAPWADRDTLTFAEYRYFQSLPDE